MSDCNKILMIILAVVLLGFLLACCGGIGCVTIKEYSDHTLYNSSDLATVFHAPPLVVIPYISNTENKSKHYKHNVRAA